MTLDTQNLQVSNIKNKIDIAINDIKKTITENKIEHVVLSFSGGHDSILSNVLATMAIPELIRGVAYANTLTGSRYTRKYIYDMCKKYDWVLYEGKPIQKARYEQLIITWGFPSPAFHNIMYQELKDKQLKKIRSDIAKNLNISPTKIISVTGLRKAESRKRNSFVELYMTKKDKNGKIQNAFICPIWNWHINERDAAIEYLGIPRNSYADYMKNSYECQCYANLSIGERERRAIISPEHEAIDKLREDLVQTAYKLQLALVEAGVWDKEDMTLKPERLIQGWHLTKKITEKDLENQDPFNLCQSCIGDRSIDGTGGIDLDMFMHPVEKKFEENIVLEHDISFSH